MGADYYESDLQRQQLIAAGKVGARVMRSAAQRSAMQRCTVALDAALGGVPVAGGWRGQHSTCMYVRMGAVRLTRLHAARALRFLGCRSRWALAPTRSCRTPSSTRCRPCSPISHAFNLTASRLTALCISAPSLAAELPASPFHSPARASDMPAATPAPALVPRCGCAPDLCDLMCAICAPCPRCCWVQNARVGDNCKIINACVGGREAFGMCCACARGAARRCAHAFRVW